MKNTIVLLTLILFNNCAAQEENVYKTFLKEFDLLFYNSDSLSEVRLNKIYKAVEFAEKYGYYCIEFQEYIKEIESYYKNFIDTLGISEIWRIDTIYWGVDKTPDSCLEIKDDNGQYQNLLESAVKKDSNLFRYKEEYLARGIIPREGSVLDLFPRSSIQEDIVRIVFYLHIISWFSDYSDNPQAARCL